jgi:far upstream element-binding protein
MQHFGGNLEDEVGRGRLTADMVVPAHRAGLVIGHHGESLKRIEKLSQCKIQFDQHWQGDPEQRRIIIVGCQEDIEEAKKLILERIDDPMSRFPSTQVMVPQGRVGLIIGKGGETIRELQEKSGARITVQPEGQVDPFATERAVTVCGDDESIQRAKDLIHELLTGQSRGGFLGASSGLRTAGNTTTIHIPESSVGAVIGRRAETLRTLQNMSGCRIYVETTSAPGSDGMRNVHLTGAPEQVTYANQLIMERVAQNEGSYYGGYDMSQASTVYQNPAEFTADPNAQAGYDYAQYYYYYQQQQQQQQQHQGQAATDPNQQQYDYSAYAAQYPGYQYPPQNQ